MLDRRFTCVRLSHPYLTWSIHAFDHNVHHRGHCAAAACGSLKPLPAERLRGTFPHLSYSMKLSRLLDTTRSSNRTGRFPASGSRKRHTMLRVTPSATSEHNLGWLDSSSIPHVLRCFLRPSLTEAPSLRRSYPASSVVRTSPPPHTARPVSRELPVDPYRNHRC